MLPFLISNNPKGTSAGPQNIVAVPPPPYFKPLNGTPNYVDVFRSNNTEQKSGNTAARSAGLRYEYKVQETLQETFGNRYLNEPFVNFRDNSEFRTARPDGIIADDLRCCVVEIKLQHCPEAWWQLTQLYKPLLLQKFKYVSVLEICRTYDPSMPFPSETLIVDSVEGWCRAPRSEFGVHVCRL